MAATFQTLRTGQQRVTVTLQELVQLASQARLLSLPASRLSSSQAGQHRSRFLGRGMEFAESRLYQAGDDIRTIDWRVTARTGKAHTKLFTVEKERQVLLWGDMRSSMYFATQGIFKSVQAALLMGYIGWNTVHAGNRLGGMLFNDSEHFEFRPFLGKKGSVAIFADISRKSQLRVKACSDFGAANMERAIANVVRLACPGSLLYLISDFRHFSPYSQELLLQLSKHSDVCLCFIYDPLEMRLPKNGNYPVTDGKGKLHLKTYDKSALEMYQRQFIDRRNCVRSLTKQRHIYFMECSTLDNCFEILHKF